MLTKPFSQLSKTDAAIAGGKGASLGEMLNAGIPVPDGFVVLSTTFDEFLKKADLIQEVEAILHTVDHKTISSIESASEKIQELIKHADMPEDIKVEVELQFSRLNSEFVAVRSSATAEDGADHAWAGQLESYLNTTKDTLLEKVQHCWASLFTPRAIFYRFEKGLDTTKISVAVVVQKMVNSEKSGIAFSVHPVTEDRNQIIIEAGFGLGEAIVSGSVTPDSYVIEKEPRKIIDINVSNQTRAMYRKAGGGNEWLDIPEKGKSQVFTDSEILALSEIIMTIENHYGFPCDIEWAYEAGKFYIVQSRPITTLRNKITTDSIINLYTKEFARDFSLPLVQAWARGETVDLRQWTEKTQPFLPYVIFERTHKTVNCYIDRRGIQWIKDEIAKYIEKDSRYIKNLVSLLNTRLDKTQFVFDNPKVLTREDLLQYISDIRDMWPLFEGVWWLMELLDDKNHPEFDIIQHVRERTNNMSTGSDKVIRDSLKVLYPELGNLSSVLLFEEIGDNVIPKKSDLELRYDSYFYVLDELLVNVTTKDIEERFNIFIERVNLNGSDMISGQVAQRGIVRGKVRILMGSVDNDLVQEGEVIVSSMTMPDMMPALKKASAFVTDEGGITCHAAIVARELNKPCVIGTRFATQILKDGDMVEVDGNRGTVTKIS